MAVEERGGTRHPIEAETDTAGPGKVPTDRPLCLAAAESGEPDLVATTWAENEPLVAADVDTEVLPEILGTLAATAQIPAVDHS